MQSLKVNIGSDGTELPDPSLKATEGQEGSKRLAWRVHVPGTLQSSICSKEHKNCGWFLEGSACQFLLVSTFSFNLTSPKSYRLTKKKSDLHQHTRRHQSTEPFSLVWHPSATPESFIVRRVVPLFCLRPIFSLEHKELNKEWAHPLCNGHKLLSYVCYPIR